MDLGKIRIAITAVRDLITFGYQLQFSIRKMFICTVDHVTSRLITRWRVYIVKQLPLEKAKSIRIFRRIRDSFSNDTFTLLFPFEILVQVLAKFLPPKVILFTCRIVRARRKKETEKIHFVGGLLVGNTPYGVLG